MRPRAFLLFVFVPLSLFALLVSACGDDSDAAATRDNVEREAREQLEMVDDEIQKLEEQVRGSDVDERVKRELDSLKDQRGKIEDKLREARDSDTWQDIQREVKAVLSDLREEIEALWVSIKDRLNGEDGSGQGGDR